MMRTSLGTAILTVCLTVLGGPAAALAQATESIEYFHMDAVGSVRMVTGAHGEVLERRDFLPFGEELAPPPNAQPLGFGGKERDAETGNGSWMALNYFGARHLHATSGRFTSVDPVFTMSANIADPQRWDRYSYARNNPLRYTDPDGRAIAAVAIEGLFSAWDTYDTYKTVTDKNATKATIGIAVGGAILGAILPGGGYGTLGKKVADRLDGIVDVFLSRARQGEAAEHAADAIHAGHHNILTIDRLGAPKNRAAAIGGLPKVPGKHLDEYPPAMFKEGGSGASVRAIDPRDNMSAGACIRNQCEGLSNGAKIRVNVVP